MNTTYIFPDTVESVSPKIIVKFAFLVYMQIYFEKVYLIISQ